MHKNSFHCQQVFYHYHQVTIMHQTWHLHCDLFCKHRFRMKITCIYDAARGSITISSIRSFRTYTDDQVVEMINNIGVQFPGWVDHKNQLTTVGINNLMSMNETLRHSEAMPAETTFKSGFIILLNVHNIYIHCHNLGHYSTVGVRSENTIIKTNTCIFIIRLPNN